MSDTDSTRQSTWAQSLLLGVRLTQRRGSSPAAAFLHDLAAQHDLVETEFLVNGRGYLTALARVGLIGDLKYVDRNLIEKGSKR